MRRLFSTVACSLALGCVNVLDDVEGPADGPAVFGRIVAVVDGERVPDFDFWSPEGFRLMILPDGAQTAFTYTPDEDGLFCWQLPPGGYSFAAWSRGAGQTLTTGHIGVRFSVPTEPEPVYIGDLVILFERGAYEFRVDDDRTLRTSYGCGGQHASASTQLMTRVADPGTFRETLPICDAFWGLDCKSQRADMAMRGVVPTSPPASRGFPRASGVTPRLMWQSVGDGRFSYDVLVYEAATWTETGVDPQYFPGRVVLYRENLAEPVLGLGSTARIRPRSRYYWTVRLRDGERVSTWSSYRHTNLSFMSPMAYMLTKPTWDDSRLFTFATP